MEAKNEMKSIEMTAKEFKAKILADPTVHNFAKEIICMAEAHDIVDALYDVKLAALVLTKLVNEALGLK